MRRVKEREDEKVAEREVEEGEGEEDVENGEGGEKQRYERMVVSSLFFHPAFLSIQDDTEENNNKLNNKEIKERFST